MDIVLCSLPSEPIFYKTTPQARAAGDVPVPPKMAIVSLVKHMQRNGITDDKYDFYDIDMLLPEDEVLYKYFERTAPGIVGLSAVTSGTYTQAKRVSKIIRNACPNAWIVLGGNMAASANVILRKTDIDLCVVGDGEIAWLKLIKHYREYGRTINENIEKIAGVSFIDGSGNLIFNGFGEKLPPSEFDYFTDYEILKKGLQGNDALLSNYFRPAAGCDWFNHDPRTFDPKRKPNFSIIYTSKGCVVRCTFCQRPTKGYRALDISLLEANLREAIDQYDIGFIFLSDEAFGIIRNQAYEFAMLMKKLDLLWCATGVRCNSITRDDVKFYADNNCVALKFGVESGSQKILDVMEKKFKVRDVEQALKWCAEFKLFSPLAIMLGMPGETDETIVETSKFIAKLCYDIGKEPFAIFGEDIFYAIPFPGTPLYEYGQQLGVIGTSVDEEESFLEGLFSGLTMKMSYINLSGSDAIDVLFWDVMIVTLVLREYEKLISSSPMMDGGAANGISTETGAQSTNSPPFVEVRHVLMRSPSTITTANPLPFVGVRYDSIFTAIIRRIKRLDFSMPNRPPVTNIIMRTVVGGRRFKWLPQSILFPALKFFLYTEYLFVRLYAVTHSKDYFKYMSPKLPNDKKIKDSYHERFPDKKVISLRDIVKADRKHPDDITERNRIKLLNGL